MVSILEGGYAVGGGIVSALARSVAAHVTALTSQTRESWSTDVEMVLLVHVFVCAVIVLFCVAHRPVIMPFDSMPCSLSLRVSSRLVGFAFSHQERLRQEEAYEKAAAEKARLAEIAAAEARAAAAAAGGGASADAGSSRRSKRARTVVDYAALEAKLQVRLHEWTSMRACRHC